MYLNHKQTGSKVSELNAQLTNKIKGGLMLSRNKISNKFLAVAIAAAIGAPAMADDTEVFFKVNPKNMDIGKTNIMFMLDEARSMMSDGQFTFDGGCVVKTVTNKRKENMDREGVTKEGKVIDDNKFIILPENGFVVLYQEGAVKIEEYRWRYIDKKGNDLGAVYEYDAKTTGYVVKTPPTGAYQGTPVSLDGIDLANTPDCYLYNHEYTRPAKMPDGWINTEPVGNKCYEPNKWYYIPRNDLSVVVESGTCIEGYPSKKGRPIDPAVNRCEGLAAKVNGTAGGAVGNFIGLFEHQRFPIWGHPKEYGWYPLDRKGVTEHTPYLSGGLSDSTKIKAIECRPDTMTNIPSGKAVNDGLYPAENGLIQYLEQQDPSFQGGDIWNPNPGDIEKIGWTKYLASANTKAWNDSFGGIYRGNYLNFLRYNAKKEKRRRGEMFRMALQRYIERSDNSIRLGLASFKQALQWGGEGDEDGKCWYVAGLHYCGNWHAGFQSRKEWHGNSDGGNIDVPIRDIDEIHPNFKWFVDHDFFAAASIPEFDGDKLMGNQWGTCSKYQGDLGSGDPEQLFPPCGWWARDIRHREFLWAKASEYFSDISPEGLPDYPALIYGMTRKLIMPGINNPAVQDPRDPSKSTTDVVYVPRMEMQGKGALNTNANRGVPGNSANGLFHDPDIDSRAVDYRPLGELLYEVARYFKGDSPKFGAYSRPETWTKHENWAKSRIEDRNGEINYVSNPDAMFHDGWGWDISTDHGRKGDFKITKGNKQYDSPIQDKCQANVAVIFTDYTGENLPKKGKGFDWENTNDPFTQETKQRTKGSWKKSYKVQVGNEKINIFPPHQDGDEQGIIDQMLSQGTCEHYTKTATDKTCSCDLSMQKWGTCLPAIAEYMANNDMRPEKYDSDGNLISGIEGKNTVNTFIVSYWDDDAFAGRTPGGVKMLEDAAEKGGGKLVRFGPSLQELDRAIGSIMNVVGINSIGAGTFVAPATSVDLGSRLQNSDQVYYSMFEPSGKNRWYGNLKSYRLEVGDKGELKVVNLSDGKTAVNAKNKFTKVAKSAWSKGTDGPDIRAGAAAENLPDVRNVFVDFDKQIQKINEPQKTWLPVNDAPSSFLALTSIKGKSANDLRDTLFSSADVAAESFGMDEDDIKKPTLGDDVLKRLAYAQGFDGNNEQVRDDKTPSLTRPFRRIGDPLHSQPKLVNYRLPFKKKADGSFERDPKDKTKFVNEAAKEGDSVLFFGTNEGYIHGIDANSGKELFSFLPLRNLATLNKYMEKQLASLNNKPYGMDGEIEVWINDISGNGDIIGRDGKVENAEYEYQHSCTVDAKGAKVCQTSKNKEKEGVYLFAGMRRGGNSYYALDVTDIEQPKLMWRITGEDKATVDSKNNTIPAVTNANAFYELGQTWAKPVVANIKIDGVGHPVVILAGGYDPGQDEAANHIHKDKTGRAIYILDAKTGKRIWATGYAADATSNINMFDTYKPDMINSIAATPRAFDADGDGFIETIIAADTGGNVWRIDIDQEKIAKTKVEKIAALSAGKLAKDARRFFTTPDVLVDRAGGLEPALVITLGSGRRPTPLDDEVDDRFYVIRSTPAIGPKKVWNNSTKQFDIKDRGTITEADMFDATDSKAIADNRKYDASATDQAKQQRDLSRKNFVKNGFYIRLGLVADDVTDASGKVITRKDAGEKVITDAVIFNGYVAYTSYLPDEIPEECGEALGDNRFNAVSLNNPDDRFFKEISQHGIAPRPAILLLADKDGKRKPAIVVGTEAINDPAMPEALKDIYGSKSRDKVIKFWADE